MPKEARTISTGDLRRNLLHYIAAHADRPLKARALARELHVADADYAAFRALVRDLLAEGLVALGPGRTLRLPDLSGNVVGVFRANRRGFGFLELPGRPDVFVPRDASGSALEGDTVMARVRHHRGDQPTAEITRVVERAPICWVGLLERSGPRWIVRPQGRAGAPTVQIDDPTAKAARPGDLVAVEPLTHTLHSAVVRGVIVERLGPPHQTQAQILGVMRRFGIPDQFPPEVRTAAQEAAADFDPDRHDGREDLRELLTITIDPRDARDFDDAISLEPLERGRVRLGVHIADVSHFVRPDGPLDLEARRRGNSAYFPGLVAPMLPEVLSNGVCSLQPGEPRLTKSAFITYDAEAAIVETRFSNSVIRSAARLTYEEASAALEGRPGELAAEVVELLTRAAGLARRIRQRKLDAGMVTLALPEVELQLGGDGSVTGAGPADTSFSHTLIEMFMVAANEAVSAYLTRRGVPHLRRIHAPPEPDSARFFSRVMGGLGYKVSPTLDRAAVRDVLRRVEGKPEQESVSYLLLRTLAKACYSPSEVGHFALASEHYCHFTSPIRRYPDLVVHRLLDAHIVPATGRKRARGHGAVPQAAAALAELGAHCSLTERRAQQAEREIKSILLLELMRGQLGRVFDGQVMGVASFGVFVQLKPTLAQGLLRIAELPADDWRFDGQRLMLIGSRSQRVISLGQSLRVRAVAINDVEQELELALEERGAVGRRLQESETFPDVRPRRGARFSDVRSKKHSDVRHAGSGRRGRGRRS